MVAVGPGRASKGQVWTRQLAPATSAFTRPSLPHQFQCMFQAVAVSSPSCCSLTSLQGPVVVCKLRGLGFSASVQHALARVGAVASRLCSMLALTDCLVCLLVLAPSATPLSFGCHRVTEGAGCTSKVNRADGCHQSWLCEWSLGLKNPSGYWILVGHYTQPHTLGQVHWGVVLLGCVQELCVCAIGVPQREPSVLHVIVDAVPGECGASHSSSLPVSALCWHGVVAGLANSACLVPQNGAWSRGERDSAPERHLVAGVPPLTETLGLLEARVQSSTFKVGGGGTVGVGYLNRRTT